jgi:hypothetical protein
MILIQLKGQIYLIKSKCKDQFYMTFIRRTGSIVTTPAGMLGVIQVETEHFKRISADLCGHQLCLVMLWGDDLATSDPVSY